MNHEQLAEWLDYLCEEDEPTLTARDFHVLAAIRLALTDQEQERVMGNPKELRRARRAAAEATDLLARIEALPRRRGSQVMWSNGVVWTRAGDDRWLPWSEDEPADMPKVEYPSAHVASGTIKRVSPMGMIQPDGGEHG